MGSAAPYEPPRHSQGCGCSSSGTVCSMLRPAASSAAILMLDPLATELSLCAEPPSPGGNHAKSRHALSLVRVVQPAVTYVVAAYRPSPVRA